MNFLDKLQEAIYDVLGYLFPGLLTIFILIPSILIYKDTAKIVLPIQALFDKTNIDKIKIIINTDFSTTKGIFILILAWLLGHLIKFLAKFFYEIVLIIENNILKGNTEQLKIESEIVNKSVKIYKKNFKDTQIKLYDNVKKEKILASFGRAQIRMYNVPSLIQKYISKYNFYCSLAFICFLMYLNIFIVFLNRYIICVIITSLLAAFAHVCLVKTLNIYKDKNVGKKKTFYLEATKKLGTFSGFMWFSIIPITIITIIYKVMFIYLIIYFISILLYSTFDNEYRRHYLLHVKAALFGIIYVDDNEQIKYQIKYNNGK